MRQVYLKRILFYFRRKWKVAIACIFISVVVFGYIGVIRKNEIINNRDNLYKDYLEDVESYQNTLSEYDTALTSLQTSIDNSKKQIEEYEKYLDNSIFMKLDSQKIYNAVSSYAVLECKNLDAVINSLVTYFNEGSMKNDIVQNSEEMVEEYLSEIISCSASGNMISFSVMHYDKEQAQYILNCIKNAVLKYEEKVSKIQGEFTLEQTDTGVNIVASTDVLYTQNLHLNNLKNYQSDLAAYEKRFIEQELNKKLYVEQYLPSNDKNYNIKFIYITHTLAGIFAGLLIYIIYLLGYTLQDTRIKSVKEIRSLYINTLGSYKDTASVCAYIKTYLEKKSGNKIFFSCLGSSNEYSEIIRKYHQILSSMNIGVDTGFDICSNQNELRKMLSIGNCLFILKLGETTFDEMQEQLKICDRLEINILGSIIID